MSENAVRFFFAQYESNFKQSNYYLNIGVHVHRIFGADDDMILCKHEDNVYFVFSNVCVGGKESFFRSFGALKYIDE